MANVPKCIATLAEFICDCGNPEYAWRSVIEILSYYRRRTGSELNDRSQENELADQRDTFDHPAMWFVAYSLDAHGLVDHGSGIAWGWLTSDGESAIQFLEEHGEEWREKPEFADRNEWHAGASQ